MAFKTKLKCRIMSCTNHIFKFSIVFTSKFAFVEICCLLQPRYFAGGKFSEKQFSFSFLFTFAPNPKKRFIFLIPPRPNYANKMQPPSSPLHFVNHLQRGTAVHLGVWTLQWAAGKHSSASQEPDPSRVQSWAQLHTSLFFFCPRRFKWLKGTRVSAIQDAIEYGFNGLCKSLVIVLSCCVDNVYIIYSQKNKASIL